MPLNYDNLSALTKDKYIPQMVDNIFDSNVLTHRMLRKSKPAASGNKVLQPLEYGKSDAKGFYSGYDVLDTSPTETFTDAQYNWKQAYATISISGKEEMLNDGPERVIDLLEAKVKNAEKSLKDLFGTTLYAGNGDSGNEFNGLQHIIAAPADASAETTAGGSLGGISRVDYTWWKAQVQAAGSSAFSTVSASSGTNSIGRELRKMYGACTVDNDHTSIIVTTQIVFDAYEESLAGQKRFGPAAATLADAGFTALMYRNTPVVVDDHCPAGMAFFLNEKYLQFRHHRKRNFVFEGFQKPVNQDASVAKIQWLGALTCSNASRQGLITGLPTAY
jgi:hypothetical protein